MDTTQPGTSKSKPISKAWIKKHLYKPMDDYWFEKIDRYTYRIHLSIRDANRSFTGLYKMRAIPEYTDNSEAVYIITTKKENQ